ncbi:MAG: hypothetical protein NVS2B7_25940 [Herpetosiphon sp.]
MLINRRTFIVKKPFFDEALAILLEVGRLARQVQPDAAFRVYACELGSFDTIAYESEAASLGAYEQALAAFTRHPVVSKWLPDSFKRWQEITESGGSNEIWRLVE